MVIQRSSEIFVSHSSADRERVESLCGRIEALGFTCWRAPRDVPEGADYAHSIHAAIERCRLFLIVLSAQSSASRHVRREIDIADRLGREILPVRISDSNAFGVLDYFVNTAQWIDYREPDADRGFQTLAELLEERLGPPRVLLAIEGGGPLGLLSVGVLKAVQSALAPASVATSAPTLRETCDLIAGSGTGAFIAAALQVGRSLDEIEDFMLSQSADWFGASVPLEQCFEFPLRSRMTPKAAQAIESFIGAENRLGSVAPDRMLALTVNRQDVGLQWTLTNHTKAKYNQPHLGQLSNLEIPLSGLATASLLWHPSDAFEIRLRGKPGYRYPVGDGTFTPYCNPAFLAFQIATARPYQLEWAASERRMLVVSVGTGQGRAPSKQSGSTFARHLAPFIGSAVDDQDLKCRLFGRCLSGPILDREVGDLIERDEPAWLDQRARRRAPTFTYLRYHPGHMLRQRWLVDGVRAGSLGFATSAGRAACRALVDDVARLLTGDHLRSWRSADGAGSRHDLLQVG